MRRHGATVGTAPSIALDSRKQALTAGALLWLWLCCGCGRNCQMRVRDEPLPRRAVPPRRHSCVERRSPRHEISIVEREELLHRIIAAGVFPDPDHQVGGIGRAVFIRFSIRDQRAGRIVDRNDRLLCACTAPYAVGSAAHLGSELRWERLRVAGRVPGE